MLRQNVQNLVFYQFESLPGTHLSHAVFTRLGGVSRGPFAALNVGNCVGDDPADVAENHARVYAHLGLRPDQVVTAGQIHSSRVAVVTLQESGQRLPGNDGLVTNVPELALMLRFADCQPILLYDPANHALGLLHAGWRGVAQAIARRGVEEMQRAYGSQPEQIIACLGPAIGPCCYTVGHDVASAMGYALPHWRRVMTLKEDGWRFDLPGANAQQLVASGVRRIEQSGLCTACQNDEFYSHRREHGNTGRFGVVAVLHGTAQSSAAERSAINEPEEILGIANGTESLLPPGLPPFGEASGGNA